MRGVLSRTSGTAKGSGNAASSVSGAAGEGRDGQPAATGDPAGVRDVPCGVDARMAGAGVSVGRGLPPGVRPGASGDTTVAARTAATGIVELTNPPDANQQREAERGELRAPLLVVD